MKKLLLIVGFFLMSVQAFSQTPEIGNFQQLTTVKRGDTLDVAWYYKPASGTDIRTFQVDWQYKKHLLTYISTTVDNSVSNNSPVADYKQWDNYKYSSYSNGTYTYSADTNWSVGRNYLILSSGTAMTGNGYIIHNKYKINSVASNFDADSIIVNWARLFKSSGASIGDNVATLNINKMQIELLGNLTISGKIYIPTSVTSNNLLPTIKCYKDGSTTLVSSTVPNASTGAYTLTNIDKKTKYKIEVIFPTDSLAALRDRAVTVSDAVKAYNEYVSTDVNQTFNRQYLKHGLSYLIGDVNLNTKFDGGDPYAIYASVSGLAPISTSKLINVFKAADYDSLVLGSSQWTSWTSYSDKGTSITDSVGTVNLTLDLKYYILGDVDRTHSSKVYDAGGAEVTAALYRGIYNVNIPDTYAGIGESILVPFNIKTNGLANNGLQFEMRYDVAQVKFDEIISNLEGPWLQYVTHDPVNGIIRFGGMNNQKTGSLLGDQTPFKLKFSPITSNTNVSSYVYVRKLMDASDKEGDHLNISLKSDRILLMSRARQTYDIVTLTEPTVVIAPNPTNGSFEMILTLPTNSWAIAQIYDISGEKVYDLGKFQADDATNKFTRNINIQNRTNGTYFLVVSNDTKKITKKILKSS